MMENDREQITPEELESGTGGHRMVTADACDLFMQRCRRAASTIRALQVDVTDRGLMTAQGLLLEAASDLKDVASENTRLMLVGVQGLLHVVQRKLWKQEEALAESRKREVPIPPDATLTGFDFTEVTEGDELAYWRVEMDEPKGQETETAWIAHRDTGAGVIPIGRGATPADAIRAAETAAEEASYADSTG